MSHVRYSPAKEAFEVLQQLAVKRKFGVALLKAFNFVLFLEV